MKFIRANQASLVKTIASQIIGELLLNKHVVWLISGGSNIILEVSIMNLVRTSVDISLTNLLIMPMDERYGELGHPASNSQLLREAGFETDTATFVDILASNASLPDTTQIYNQIITNAFATADIAIGQFGLGTDGHIAGILPGSPATKKQTIQAVGYKWHDYIRLTLAPRALMQISVAYVAAYGEDKKHALERLRHNTEPLSTLPGSLLYKLPEVYVYNSFIESE